MMHCLIEIEGLQINWLQKSTTHCLIKIEGLQTKWLQTSTMHCLIKIEVDKDRGLTNKVVAEKYDALLD